MNNNIRLFNVIGISFMTVLLSAFILTYFGLIDLKIISDMTFSPLTEYVANFIMFMINMFFWFSIALMVFDKRIWIILIGYMPVYIIFSFMPYNYTLFASTLIPLLYIIIIAVLKLKIKYNDFAILLVRFGVFLLLLGIFQKITGFIKLNNFNLDYYKCNSAVAFIYSSGPASGLFLPKPSAFQIILTLTNKLSSNK